MRKQVNAELEKMVIPPDFDKMDFMLKLGSVWGVVRAILVLYKTICRKANKEKINFILNFGDTYIPKS